MIRHLIGALALALVIARAQSASAGEFDSIGIYVPADSVWVLGVDTGALRDSGAAQQILDGVRPAELLEPLEAFVGDTAGASAIPAATVLVASPSFDREATDLLVAVVFDTAQPDFRAAIAAQLSDWEIVNAESGDDTHPMFVRSGVAFASPDDSTAFFGNVARVQSALVAHRTAATSPPPAAPLAFDDRAGAVVLHATTPPASGFAWAAWLQGVSASFELTEAPILSLQLRCAAADQEAAELMLNGAMGPLLASPQIAALLPGPPPTYAFERSEDALTIRFALDGETWDALIRSAAAAVQSEFR